MFLSGNWIYSSSERSRSSSEVSESTSEVLEFSEDELSEFLESTSSNKAWGLTSYNAVHLVLAPPRGRSTTMIIEWLPIL